MCENCGRGKKGLLISHFTVKISSALQQKKKLSSRQTGLVQLKFQSTVSMQRTAKKSKNISHPILRYDPAYLPLRSSQWSSKMFTSSIVFFFVLSALLNVGNCFGDYANRIRGLSGSGSGEQQQDYDHGGSKKNIEDRRLANGSAVSSRIKGLSGSGSNEADAKTLTKREANLTDCKLMT